MSLKSNLINFQINTIDYFKIDHILIGHWVRAFHYNSPIYLFIFMCLLPKNICIFMLLFFFLFILTLFILFKGCWISSLENKLLNDNINICDIFLDILLVPINNKNRFIFTLCIGAIYAILLIFVFYFRFLFNFQSSRSEE